MLNDSLMLTVAGMGSVFLFLTFLVALMYAGAAVFSYIGPRETTDDGEDGAVVAAIAVALDK